MNYPTIKRNIQLSLFKNNSDVASTVELLSSKHSFVRFIKFPLHRKIFQSTLQKVECLLAKSHTYRKRLVKNYGKNN
jgi:hypothetical protein